MKPWRIGSLFSGIGGFELGLSNVKRRDGSPAFEVSWQVELDEYCREVLAKNFPEARRFGDIREFPEQDLVDELQVEMITGGFPCPTVSLAGLRKGALDEERWLWPHMHRVLEIFKPTFCMVENVYGLLSAKDLRGRRGGLLGGILHDLASLGYGAGDGFLEYHCIPAASIGALHRRDRIWIIGKLADTQREGPQGLDSKPRRAEENGQALGEGLPAREVPDTIGKRGRGRDDTREDAEDADSRGQVVGPTRDSGWWSTQCRLGGVTHGLPDGLDECRGWECGVPRVKKGQTKRIARLKALGNAVVPPLVQFLGEELVKREGV